MEQSNATPPQTKIDPGQSDATASPAQKLKQEKWNAFCERNKAAIERLPTVHNKKRVPCIWSEVQQDWIWMSRQMRRRAERSHTKRVESLRKAKEAEITDAQKKLGSA